MVSPNLLWPTGHFTEIVSLPAEPQPSWMQRVRARLAHLARITGLLPWQCFTETVADPSVRGAVCVDYDQPGCYFGGWELFVKWSEVRARGCIHPPQRRSLTVMFAWSLSLGCNESVCSWRCAVSVVFLLRPSGWGTFLHFNAFWKRMVLLKEMDTWFYLSESEVARAITTTCPRSGSKYSVLFCFSLFWLITVTAFQRSR